jgi:peptidyl-prolyl cis-trans isomerase SurA
MMRFQSILHLTIVIILLCNIVIGQKVAAQTGISAPDPVIATIGKEKITVSGFELFYNKSANAQVKKNNPKAPADDRRQFLDMLVNYRVKLAEAYHKHLDTDPEIINELNQYKKNISTSYYINRQLVEPNLKVLYERKKIEVHGAHIFIARKNNSSPEDTVKAYQKALDVLAQAHAGVPFDSLAMKYSDDASTKFLGGDAGIFSVGYVHPSLEDEYYTLNIGEISKNVVISSAGYHIIKLLDRFPTVNVRQVSHIMIRYSPTDTPEDSVKKVERITLLRDSVLKGADFGALAQMASEDPGTASRQGDIGFIARRQSIPSFDEFIYSAKIGDVSPVLRTRAGYHILKITGEQPLGSFDDLKEGLRGTYKKLRYNDDLRKLTDKLKQDLKAEINRKTMNVFIQKLDTSRTVGSTPWDSLLTNTDRSLVLYSYAGKSVELDSLITYLSSASEYKNAPVRPGLMKAVIEKLLADYVLEYTAQNIKKESSDFTDIMKEYREGLMIYKLEQNNVWEKVSINDKALRVYYKKNKSRYKWGDRVDFSEIFVQSDSLAKMLIDSIHAGIEFDSIAAHHTKRVGMKQKLGRWGMKETKDDPLAQAAYTMEPGMVSKEPVKGRSGYSILLVHAKEPARDKTFEEASSEVTVQYQDQQTKSIEAAWVASLKKKTPIKVYDKVFSEYCSKK